MSYISKLLCMWQFTLCLGGYNVIKVIQNSTTWNEALTHCSEQNSKLAVIADIERNRSCVSIFMMHGEKPFWVGNFYKLSGRISVKGCYKISNSTMEVGYKTLYECFVLCSRGMKEVGLFAYKAVFESNCICDHHLHLNHSKDFQMVEAYQCSNISLLWWVYTVIQNDFNSVHETCHQFTCTDSQVKYNTLRNSLCEKNSQKDYHDLRSEIPRENLPYGCERNAENNNSIVFPDYFRFALNSSVNTDSSEKPLIPFICKALSCAPYNSFSISIQNCNSTTFGILCVKNESIFQSSTSMALPTTSTVSYASLKESQHSKSTSYRTTSTKITNTTFKPQTSDVSSHTNEVNVENSQLVFTTHAQSTEGNVIIKTLKITSSKKYSSPFNHSYVTDRNERKIAESTPGSFETLSDGHFRIGLIVGSAVGTIVMIVVGVLLICCRFRRRGPFRKKKLDDHIQRDFQNAIYDVHTPNDDNILFGLVDVPNNNSNTVRNNEYTVVVKNTKSDNQVVQQHCTNGRNSNNLVESKYDRVNHARPRSAHNFTNNRHNEYTVGGKNNQSSYLAVEQNCTNERNSNNLVESNYDRVNHARTRSANNFTNNRHNEYAVGVKNNHSSNQEVGTNCDTNGRNSDDMLESEYDRLNHARPRNGKDSCNLYDSALGFRDDYDATYNTTDYRRTDKVDDSLYDHN
ncbi:probable serine/threonine-protein kinase DDB_G0283337 isoform X2 [Mytilus edulis]|uniref:probable serine/threonine-protein kinase DDB_G0283337 isoform X2 n=1 Tax=Mytilus edulis TaxID=6550 RepID=UPI0039EFC4CC